MMQRVMLRPDSDFYAKEHYDDVVRIVEAFAALGYVIDKSTAMIAWQRHSQDMCAGWMSVHRGKNMECYKRIFKCIEEYLTFDLEWKEGS